MARKILLFHPNGCLEESDQSLLCFSPLAPTPTPAPLADFIKEKREEKSLSRFLK